MKKKLKILLLMLAVLLLTSCGSDGKSADAREVIRIIYPISRGMGDKDIAGLQEWFQNKYPNEVLEMVSASVTTITDSVRSDIKNGNGADIFVTTDYDSFLEEGLLANITDTEAAYWYRKSSTSALERDGQLYALPIGGGNLVALHYNKELFARYGLEEPKSTETFQELAARVQKVIDDNQLDKTAVNASMLYPEQVSLIYNSIFAEETQSAEYLKWVLNNDDKVFSDSAFQRYLNRIAGTMEKDHALFASGDFENSTATSIEKFLEGNSFLFIGDVMRCYDTIQKNDAYDIGKIGVVGIPSGMENISYVSYMDDLYLGITSDFENFSPEKRHIIEELMDYIATGDSEIRNIFTFTGEYCSNYLEGESVELSDDPYFAAVNDCLAHNYVEQEVNNNRYSTVFGKSLIAWRKGRLDKYCDLAGTDQEKVTALMNAYRDGQNPFAKSEEPIGTSPMLMEYQSNLVRGQETALGNQVADMARSYMDADFALLNAGGIRASIPEGNVSVQTFDSVLPYTNYLVKIRVSGATLKAALTNAYNVGPGYKAGKFGDISGLKVVLRTKDAGYEEYLKLLKVWENKNPNADAMAWNDARTRIVQEICADDEEKLNMQILSVTDTAGNPIEDNRMYTVATMDYLLKDQDGYTMLGVLSNNPQADQTIAIFDRNGAEITGTAEEKTKQIESRCKTGADSFVEWVQEGHALGSAVDGRITMENFVEVQ